MAGGKEIEVGVEKDLAEQADDGAENADLVLFQVKECYVYMIPPRKSAASYRADEWDINKWAWEGVLKVVSKVKLVPSGWKIKKQVMSFKSANSQCGNFSISTVVGDLYAQAPIRQDQPLPVEAVIDSSRFFVLRVEDESSGKVKHAFVGLGFRERPQAYDFQAAVFDHVKYLNKKKEAEEMEQEYQAKPSVNYSLKEGETLRLQLKTVKISGTGAKPKLSEKTMNGSEVREPMPNPDTPENYPKRQGLPYIVPPPPPPALQAQPSPLIKLPSLPDTSAPVPEPVSAMTKPAAGSYDVADELDEDFGDFQAA